MIIGNPYQFSIISKVIDEWNTKEGEHFKNGVLLICIDGNVFPKEVVTATLAREILILEENLDEIAVNKKLFEMETEEAFTELYRIRFPSGNCIYDVSPDSLADMNCYVFAVSSGTQVRFLAAELEYTSAESTHNLLNAKIVEAFVTNEELRNIVSELGKILS
jgi:hypothetical protein